MRRASPRPEEEDCSCPQCGKPCKPHAAETSTAIELRIEAFQRVMADTDPASLERVAQRWTQPCTREAQVLAADGKRMRGANRLSPEGLHWETVTLVDHAAGVPVASRSYREEGGERQALRDLLEEVGLRGRVITLDAGHAGKEIQEVIVKQRGGDVVVTLKGNCPETCATLRGL